MVSRPDSSQAAVRVAVVTNSFPELSATFILDQVAALRDAGLKVRVFAERFQPKGLRHALGRELAAGATFFEQSRLTLLSQKTWLPGRIRERLRREAMRRHRMAPGKCDLVLCHFGPSGLKAVEALSEAKHRPPVWTVFHGYDLSREVKERGEGFYAPLFEAGELFLPISLFWAERLAALGCPPDRTRLLRMGVDCGAIPFAPAPHATGGTVNILSVGRLIEKKGTEFALRALAEIAKASPDLDWTFDIIGEGPLEEELRRLAEALGIDGSVHFLGARSTDEVRERLGRAHIFLLPSVEAADGDMEGIPVALMEAMAAGAAVVSSVHSGIPELVEQGVSGLLAPERDVAALARQLGELIADGAMRSRLSVAARAKVEAEFNQERINREFVEFIRAQVRPR
jgi:colanic acid/amylovoran biosynthesis glycosyltransferase